MKFKTITAVSVLSLMIAFPAYANDTAASAVSGDAAIPPAFSKDNGVVGNVKTGFKKADDGLHDAADDIKAFFMGKNPDHRLEPVLIHRNLTAHGMLDASIVNSANENIATVKDIIIDKDGKAILVVVSDGGLLGIGSKVAAFNYDKVVEQKPDGKIVMSLSQDMVDHAADFSYDQNDWATAKVIPAGSISVDALLKGKVLDNNGRKVADIENVYFRSADVSQIIVGFDKKFGMNGSLAALDYNDLQMVDQNGEHDFKLTANQTAEFKNFKKSVTN